MPKNAVNYVCETCDFKCCKYSNYKSHLKTKKHSQSGNDNKMVTNDNANCQKNADYICNCGNVYKYMSGLSRHKKQCKLEIPEPSPTEPFHFITPELVMQLINDNKDMKQIILEQNNTINTLVKNGTTNNNHSLNNNNNKTFNLQFFLNETCKDAMNIMDFVDSIKLQLSDLERMGEVGYAEGISNIITTNLKALDITQRPVHCTDKKRETMYVKDQDKWEKDEDKSRLKYAIKRIQNKNILMLPQFRKKYPECNNSSSKISDKYDKMALEVFGGNGKNSEEKILHNISKCTVVDK